MPDSIVTNTGPLIALIAGMGSLRIFNQLYSKVIVPWEVSQEILIGGRDFFGVDTFQRATFLETSSKPIDTTPYLLATLDRGEASVIQTAINLQITAVCIDEQAGRRAARLSGLQVTGSLGVLLRAKRERLIESVLPIMDRMIEHGIWISPLLYQEARRLSNE